MIPPPTLKQARIIWLALTGLAIAALAALMVAAVWGLGKVLDLLSPVLWPLAVAGVLAYLLDPVVDFLERKRIPRTRAILCVFALAFVLLVALFSSVVPQLVVEARQLVIRIPAYSAAVQKRVEDWVNKPPPVLRRFLGAPNAATTNDVATNNLPTNAVPVIPTNAPTTAATASATSTNAPPEAQALWTGALDKQTLRPVTEWLAKALPMAGGWLLGQLTRVASWFGVLAGLALIPVYAFYFLMEKRGIESKWTDYLPVARSDFKDELVFVLKAINGYLIVFFRGQVLVSICDGILYAIGFLIIGLPYAILIGAMATVLTIIPFLGAFLTCAAALIIAFVQYGDWKHPVEVLGVFAVVQALEGLVIQPKILGDRVGLHPLTIIVAVMVGTTLLGGILGGLLAIPLTAAGRVLMFRYVWKDPTTVISKD
jgi:predicted PurR-regulated permease PerM